MGAELLSYLLFSCFNVSFLPRSFFLCGAFKCIFIIRAGPLKEPFRMCVEKQRGGVLEEHKWPMEKRSIHILAISPFKFTFLEIAFYF